MTTSTTDGGAGSVRVQRRAPVFSAAITPDERIAAIALTGIRGLGAARISIQFRGREREEGEGPGTVGAAAGGSADAPDSAGGALHVTNGADDRPVAAAGGLADTPAASPTPSPTPSAVLRALVPDAAERASLVGRVQRLLESCEGRGIRIVSFVDPAYPPSLFHLESPPPLLYTLGDLSMTARPAVAIVGSRHATSYGLRVARGFAARLAEHGVCVVSGLAAGVDAASHLGALDARGATIAVQGTGVDVAYPRAHAALHARIARDGLVLSELPPGRGAHKGAFPNRNRIIAALADVVLVVEAGLPSGALVTAERGDQINRPVGAVPGPIDSPMSRGTNQLIRDGKHCIASFDDLMALLALSPRVLSQGLRLTPVRGAASAPAGEGGTSPGATADGGVTSASGTPGSVATGWSGDPGSPEGRLLEVLAHGPQGSDDLVRACAMAPREVATALATLSLVGLVEVDAVGMVQRLDRSLEWRAGAAR
ncbi:MAG: DNA-protecting protein DprA [Gemmatimonadaceae bacterium]|nr:DNA-protecting protein DprA [Gemmatimonadaceae bacterium]